MDFYEFLKKKAEEDGIEKFIAGAIITNEKNEVLIVRRKKDDFMGGIYEIPSGNLEKDENIYEALIRETKEETNLNVEKVESYIDQFEYLSGSCKKCRQFNFEVSVSEGEILLTEHDMYKWLPLNEIEKENEISPELKHSLMIYKFNKEQNAKEN